MSARRDGLRLWAYAKPVVDAILVTLAFVLAYYVRYQLQWWREVEPTY